MSDKKEFLVLAEDLYEIAYEEGKEDGKDEALASLRGLSLYELTNMVSGAGGSKAAGRGRGRDAKASRG
jgi:hypothetical protein